MWTKKEIEDFNRYLDNPIVYGVFKRVRKKQFCIYSGDLINIGEGAHGIKIYPNEITGRCLEIDKPMIFYACGQCPACFH